MGREGRGGLDWTRTAGRSQAVEKRRRGTRRPENMAGDNLIVCPAVRGVAGNDTDIL